MNKIILYIATSKDGYIADHNGGVDWLPQPSSTAELEVVGYYALLNSIDTIVMGSKSYQQIIGFGDWGWKDKQTYVFSQHNLAADEQYVVVTKDTPRAFVSMIKNRAEGKNVWLLGGASLAQSFAKEGLIDQVILTVVPTVLSKGISLGIDMNMFVLDREQVVSDCIVQLFYNKQ